MDRKWDQLDEAERKAREKRHQQMDDREPPGDSRHVATEPEEEWREKEDAYGDEIKKAMETRVQKIHELIIARVSAVSRCEDDEAFQSEFTEEQGEFLDKHYGSREKRDTANAQRREIQTMLRSVLVNEVELK
jgi:hypothetical protein